MRNIKLLRINGGRKEKMERKLNTGEKECWKRETEKKINGNGAGTMNVERNYERRIRLTNR